MNGSYLVSYGAGNVRSLANAIKQLGFEFKWVEKPEDIEKADVRLQGRAGRADSHGYAAS